MCVCARCHAQAVQPRALLSSTPALHTGHVLQVGWRAIQLGGRQGRVRPGSRGQGSRVSTAATGVCRPPPRQPRLLGAPIEARPAVEVAAQRHHRVVGQLQADVALKGCGRRLQAAVGGRLGRRRVRLHPPRTSALRRCLCDGAQHRRLGAGGHGWGLQLPGGTAAVPAAVRTQAPRPRGSPRHWLQQGVTSTGRPRAQRRVEGCVCRHVTRLPSSSPLAGSVCRRRCGRTRSRSVQSAGMGACLGLTGARSGGGGSARRCVLCGQPCPAARPALWAEASPKDTSCCPSVAPWGPVAR